MKTLFIGLLIVAAGAVIFLLLQKNDRPLTTSTFQQEKIIGKWKFDSILFTNDSIEKLMPGIELVVDSRLRKYHYEFTKDGPIAFSVGDSLVKDSSTYEWNKEKQLVWKEQPADSSGDVFTITQLTNHSLALQSKDSSVLLFTKVN